MAALNQAMLIPSGPAGHHLFFVISGPAPVAGYGASTQVILASICSVPNNVPYHTACVLQVGQHPFIQHPSYVSYRHLRIETEAHVDNMIATNVWIPQPACSNALLQQIVSQVCASRLTPREFKQLFNCP